MNWMSFLKTVHHIATGAMAYVSMGSLIPIPAAQAAAGVLGVILSVIAHATPDDSKK